MITPLPGVTTTKPGSATVPFPASPPSWSTQRGKRLEQGGGFLTITQPWPGMLRTIYGDDARYRETYWSRVPGPLLRRRRRQAGRSRLLVDSGPGR